MRFLNTVRLLRWDDKSMITFFLEPPPIFPKKTDRLSALFLCSLYRKEYILGVPRCRNTNQTIPTGAEGFRTIKI